MKIVNFFIKGDYTWDFIGPLLLVESRRRHKKLEIINFYLGCSTKGGSSEYWVSTFPDNIICENIDLLELVRFCPKALVRLILNLPILLGKSTSGVGWYKKVFRFFELSKLIDLSYIHDSCDKASLFLIDSRENSDFPLKAVIQKCIQESSSFLGFVPHAVHYIYGGVDEFVGFMDFDAKFEAKEAAYLSPFIFDQVPEVLDGNCSIHTGHPILSKRFLNVALGWGAPKFVKSDDCLLVCLRKQVASIDDCDRVDPFTVLASKQIAFLIEVVSHAKQGQQVILKPHPSMVTTDTSELLRVVKDVRNDLLITVSDYPIARLAPFVNVACGMFSTVFPVLYRFGVTCIVLEDELFNEVSQGWPIIGKIYREICAVVMLQELGDCISSNIRLENKHRGAQIMQREKILFRYWRDFEGLDILER